MNKFLNLPYGIRICIGLMVAAAMFVGIWQLNGKRQAAEVVWATGDKAIEHNLSKLPLRVFVDSSLGAHAESAEKAERDMNSATCTLMVPTYDLARADVHVRHEPCGTGNPNHPACTWRDLKTGQIVIQVGQPGDITASYLIFFHEFTHAFGLAHDGFYKVPARSEDSLLFVPITANNAFEHAYRLGHGLHLPRLSDKDKAALRSRYCGK